MQNTIIISREVSERIRALKFMLILGVVFIHMGDNYENVIKLSNDSFAHACWFVIYFLSDVLAATAVPLFFLMSSVLFFKDFRPTQVCYVDKLKNRFRTLVIPYLFWLLAYLAFKFTVQSLPFLSGVIGGDSKRIVEYKLYDYFDALSGWTSFPISYQFWFIRDLIVIVCISPVIWLAVRYLSWLVPVLFLVLWVLDIQRVANVHYEGLLFFTLGCLVIQHGLRLTMKEGQSYLLLLVYLCLALAIALANSFGISLPVASKLVLMTGVVAVWYGSGLLEKVDSLREYFVRMSSYSFFIYAAHEPLLGILVKITNKSNLRGSLIWQFLLYWIYPVIVVLSLWSLSKVLKSRVPQTYALLTGGRA